MNVLKLISHLVIAVISLCTMSACFGPVVGSSCEDDLSSCKDGCFDLLKDEANCGKCGNQCDAGATCIEGECTSCPPDKLYCDASCIDPLTSNLHCGACGIKCDNGSACISGQCVGCEIGETLCDGQCVDTVSSVIHCGACSNACTEDAPFCVNGSCALTCPDWMVLCDGECINVNSDPNNCSACNVDCPDSSPYCQNSVCTDLCTSDTSLCAGLCVDLLSDHNNCGTCDNSCTELQVCSQGECISGCAADETECAGDCVNLLADKRHCGACGKSCADNEICAMGQCALSCGTNQIICDSECVTYINDRNNCGSCSITCNTGEVCAAGQCIRDCGLLTYCNGSCVDTAANNDHCGTCGIPCEDTFFCVDGSCQADCPLSYSYCDDQCVNSDTSPFHCGGCNIVCETGICIEGSCALERSGHAVLIGHNYLNSNAIMARLLTNAVFISPEGSPKILSFDQWAVNSSYVQSVNSIISTTASVLNRSYTLATVSSAIALNNNLLNYDVLLIYEQSLATDAELVNLAESAYFVLREFLSIGGTIVLLDGGQGNSGTWQILNEANLMELSSSGPCDQCTIEITVQSDAVAQGTSTYYLSQENSTVFVGTENAIAEDMNSGLPIIIHNIYNF